MVYKMHKNGSYNIHTVKTDRFKNIKMEIVFRNNIQKETIAIRTLLFEVLLETSEYYKTKRDLILKCEELYNALVYSHSSKIGGEVLSTIVVDFLNPKYTRDDYLCDALKLPFDILFHPNVVLGEFDLKTLDIVKNRFIADLKCIKENPKKYALREALNYMDAESVSSVNINGTIETIEAITVGDLYQEYLNCLNHDYIDIFIIGDIDEDRVIDEINKYANFKTIKNHGLNLFIDNKKCKKVREHHVDSDFTQSQIVAIMNVNGLSEKMQKYDAQIFNMILGGGSLETKLYKNLRDKNSLCYNVYSLYLKYDNLLVIGTSVDKKNVNKAIKLIKSSIDEMYENVSNEEVSRAISSVITSINMSTDSPGQIIDQYLFQYISSLDSIDERLKNYKKVTKEDVMKVASHLSLNTIYVIEGDENE